MADAVPRGDVSAETAVPVSWPSLKRARGALAPSSSTLVSVSEGLASPETGTGMRVTTTESPNGCTVPASVMPGTGTKWVQVSSVLR